MPMRPSGVLATKHAQWLEARGLDLELCERMGIETATSGKDSGGAGDWIAIPYLRGEKRVNHKYRCLSKKAFMQDKGGEQTWWNFNALTDQTLKKQPLVICEGELDAMAAIQAGYVRTVSVPGGAPTSEIDGKSAKLAFVADTIDLMRGDRDIILACDGDEPGRALLSSLSRFLGRARCRYVEYPEGCKDLGDILREHGTQAVTQAIYDAKPAHVPGLYRMSELPPVPEPKPHVTGIPGLENRYKIRKSDLAVITGIPGCGKSTFVNDLTCRMADRYGWTTVFASFEQNPQIDHKRALRTWHGRLPAVQLSLDEERAADRWIDEHFSFVVPGEDEEATLDWLLDMAASSVIRHGADILVLDPWNEMDHAKPRDMTTTEYVGAAIRQLKRFAREWNVHLIVVAHPAKIFPNKDGSTPMPSLYSIADSAHFFNKPDVGMIIHPAFDRLARQPYTKLKIAKSRYHDLIGAPGTATLKFNNWNNRFDHYDVTREDDMQEEEA